MGINALYVDLFPTFNLLGHFVTFVQQITLEVEAAAELLPTGSSRSEAQDTAVARVIAK